MSVSSAMYAAITGLDTMGTAMSVISNNIANVNTIGFKAARAEFMDLLSQNYHSAAGSSQIGRGVRLGAVKQIFSQGSFKNSSQDTDIAIGGEGFFQVRDPVDNQLFYTRAGNFTFNSDGEMELPTGHILQGWALDDQGERIGTPTDVTMLDVNAPPEETERATYIVNLDADDVSNTDSVHLSSRWDGSQTNYIDGQAYAYQTSLRVYDSLGGAHDLSIYFDPDDQVDNKWEYIVCCNPEEDYRTHNGDVPISAGGTGVPFYDHSDTAPSPPGTVYAGLLQRGTITFEPTDPNNDYGGQIREITADTLVNNIDFVNPNVNPPVAGGTWPAAVTLSSQGRYQGTVAGNFTFQLIDAEGSGTATYEIGATQLPDPPTGAGAGPWAPVVQWTHPDGVTTGLITLTAENTWITVADGVQIQVDDTAVPPGPATVFAPPFAATDSFTVNVTPDWQAEGSTNRNGYFTINPAFLTDPGPGPVTPPQNPTGLPVYQEIEIDFGAYNLTYPNNTWTLSDESTTQYSAPSSTLFQTQDGYPSGYLQSISIDSDGVLSGTYSNGRIVDAWQIGLALFRNPWGLNKVGDNLYEETRDSGESTINPPGTGGTGVIAPNALEQSNVDLADEFVDMIVQQRAFQANSKIITTTDTMLAELINLKR